MNTDALPASLATAFNISSADNAFNSRTPTGGSTVVTPATTVTAAPRFNAASASAKPIFPDDRFEINRTGSIASRVAPTVIKALAAHKLLAVRGPENLQCGANNALRLAQTPRTDRPARHLTRIRLDEINSVRAKLAKVSLRCRMFPHRRVHSGRNQNGRGAGEVSRAEKVVSDSIREFSDDIRGRGRDDQQIDSLR